ncbi:hypothetical protein Ddye_019569 [Dipteronia dyeriana]|uniref:Uncharacterized protein n=1 Tax=Dipteronia dyeriana TaxID=168575 RepID=A0AAD9TZ44_9ROSI|nr:hypothetical protein Ddye_019569 [Dipteronia dyeriana]
MDKLDEEKAHKKKSRANLEDELDEFRINTVEIRTRIGIQVYQRKKGPMPANRRTKGIIISDEGAAQTRAA